MKKLYCVVAFTFVISMSVVFAGEQIRLYKEFTSGMTYREVKSKPHVLDATELGIPGIRLYRDVEKFAGHNWEQLFSFHNDKLIDVSLVSNVLEQYAPAVLTVANSGFTLAHMTSAAQELDCLLLQMTETQEAVFQAITAFEQKALNDNHLELLYIDNSAFEKIAPKLTSKESLSQLLVMFPESTRTVEIIATVSDDSESILIVSFSTPIHAMGMLTEDF